MIAALQDLRDQLRRAASSHLSEADTAHDLAHLDRVWRNVLAIAETEGGDQRILLAAAYLHDLVSPPKDHPDRARASCLAAEAAVPILQGLGFSVDEIAACRHAIAAHSFSAGLAAETLEARILQDADRLDGIGAIGIARVFAVSGGLGRRLLHPDDPFAAQRPLDDQTQALDHFATKLMRLPAMMQTAAGRKLAEGRAVTMAGFLQTLGAEIGADPTEYFLP